MGSGSHHNFVSFILGGGGWRMRLALAQALFVPHADLILLDECTNHLDLHGMDWLMETKLSKRANGGFGTLLRWI